MAFEPNFEKVVSSYKKKIGEMQSQLECKLPIAEDETVLRILCTNVKANVLSSEILQSSINFNGVATIQVIYTTQNGETKSVDYTLEFKDKYNLDSELNMTQTIFNLEVIDIRANAENNNIKVSAILNVCVDGIFSDTVNVLIQASGEDVFVKYEDIQFSEYLGLASEKFEQTFDIEINDAVMNVLSVCPNTYIDRVELHENYIKIFGGVFVTTTYNTVGENSKVRTYDIVFDFSQEVALTGVNENSSVVSDISTIYQNIGVTTNLSEDKAIINLVVPVEYNGNVWNQKTLQVVSDIYSSSNYLNVNIDSFNVQQNYDPKTFKEHFVGSVTIDENDLFIDEVLGNCCSNVIIASQRVANEILVIDGVVNTSVVYKNLDTNSIVSYDVQIPFSLDLRVGNVMQDVVADINLALVDVNTKVRRGTEIEVSGSLLAYVNLSNINEDAVINSIVIEDEKPLDDCNLIIYIAKDGDTIWNIAKELSVSEDIILEQNPNLELPLNAGNRIVIYKQRLADLGTV